MTLVTQSHTSTTTDAPLLSYTITTTPNPLKASPENPADPEQRGELLIVASRRGGKDVNVKSIKVKVPAGSGASALASNLDEVVPKISLTDWKVEDPVQQTFECIPTGLYGVIGSAPGLTIQLADIPINREVGTATITITELASTTTDDADFTERKIDFHIGKFPADFYMDKFMCTPLVIQNGEEVTLTWERSTNATYELLYGDVHIPDVTNETTRTISNIASDTTFYLRGNAGDATNPVVRILSAHVTVLKPDLNIGNLIVNGTITANGNVSITAGHDLSVPKILGTGSHIELASSLLQTEGSITAAGLRVRGNAAVFGDFRATTLASGLPAPSASMPAKENYPLENMLDGSAAASFISDGPPAPGDWVMLDLGEVCTITTRVDFTLSGSPMNLAFDTSTDGDSWENESSVLHGTRYFSPPGAEFTARYLRLKYKGDTAVNLKIGEWTVTPEGRFTV
ncbi:discoidin domain-containing protein [Streptomyces sp. NPDC048242]|uniref:discoidin domain-containing protein n=1 Tax=Streptomyces sp. NPDC048242 TaxID=3155026 RepID=UPI003430C33C